MATPITVYSTAWCGHCKRLLRQLEEADIAFRVIDLDQEPQHGGRIEAKTGGFRTVPTLEIDGDLLVNPTIVEVQAALGRWAAGAEKHRLGSSRRRAGEISLYVL